MRKNRALVAPRRRRVDSELTSRKASGEKFVGLVAGDAGPPVPVPGVSEGDEPAELLERWADTTVHRQREQESMAGTKER